MKLKYEYDPDDVSQYYDVQNNPNNTNEINGLLLLKKYNYDLVNSTIAERDIIEMGRIISRLYEDSIFYMDHDLSDYIISLSRIRYSELYKNHIIYYVAHAERLRSKFIVRLNQAKETDISMDYIYSEVLSKENIIETYNRVVDQYTATDRVSDIKEFTENNIFDEKWFYEFVMRYTTNFDENTIFIIKDLIVGGIFHEYMW